MLWQEKILACREPKPRIRGRFAIWHFWQKLEGLVLKSAAGCLSKDRLKKDGWHNIPFYIAKSCFISNPI
jgi:hypothetical protein